MANPINNVSRTVSRPADTVKASNNQAVNGVGKAAPTGDSIQLTSTAEALHKSDSSEPTMNLAKIAEIKDALASGNFRIDAEKVAEKFIEVERALGKV